MSDTDIHIDAVISLLGRKSLALKLGVGPRAVSEAKSRGVLPAAWFDVVEREAAAKGLRVSRSLFSFRCLAETEIDSAIEHAERDAAPQERGPLPRIDQSGCAG